jgi:ClpX C4-type zinc finger
MTTTNISKLAEHINAIRALGKQTIATVIELGRHFSECKRIVGQRDFGCWLNREFPRMGERHVRNFIYVFELAGSKSENFSELDLPVSAFYQLAAPSTPEPVRDKIIGRAEAGEKFELQQVKEEIAKAKPARARKKSSLKASDTPPMPPEETVALVASSGEYVRLQKQIDELGSAKRRLETENIGLRSEVDDLRKPKLADAKGTVHCSFCGRGQHNVQTIIESSLPRSKASICNECIAICNEVIAARATEKKPAEPAPIIDDGLDIPESLRRSPTVPDSESNTSIADQKKTVH